MPKVNAHEARSGSKAIPYKIAPIRVSMLDLHTLRANAFQDLERWVALKEFPQRTFFEIVKLDRSTVASQFWKKSDDGVLPYRVTLRDYFSEVNLKPTFSSILPERFCEAIE